MRIFRLAGIACAALQVGTLAAATVPNPRLRLRETGIPVFGGSTAPSAVYSVSASGTSADGEVSLRKGTETCRLTGYSIGRTFSEQAADYSIGDFLDELPAKVNAGRLDWEETLLALGVSSTNENRSGYVVFSNEQDPARRILFTRGGTMKLPFMERDGNGQLVSNVVVMTIGGTSGKKRPYRLYATDPNENNTAAYVDLTGKYVKFYGAPELLTPRYSKPSQQSIEGGFAVSNVVWGLDYDPSKSSFLSARYESRPDGTYDSPEGSVVMVYFKTELKRDIAAAIVVQIVPPEVTTLEAEVGDELRPIGGGYEIEDLHVSVASGAEADPNDPYAPYVEPSGSSTVRALVPTDKSTNKLGIDMPWKANLYWKSADPMGTLWTFENDWYLIRWPADPVRLVISPEKDDPGLGFVIPTNYTVTVGSFRDPVAMNVGYDAASGRVTCDREGRFVLKLAAGAGGGSWYLPVETFQHGNMKVCSGHFEPNPWPVGRRVVPTAEADEKAQSRAAFADVDPDLPGYIYARFSDGRNWNPRLYHEPKTDFAAQMAEVGSSAPDADGNLGSDPYAKLESAIYGVNECPDKSIPGVLEVWWRATYQEPGMPVPITYPTYVQIYRFSWDETLEDGNLPEIVLSSQQGSYDKNGHMTAAGGRAARLVWNYSSGSVEYPGAYSVTDPTKTGFSFMLYVPTTGELAKDEQVETGRLARLGAGGSRANDVRIDLAAVGTDEALVAVSTGDGTVTNAVPRGIWTPVALERLPDSFAGGKLTVSFGDDDEKLEGESAVGVSIDGIELKVRGEDECVYRFDFSDADLGPSKDGTERVAFASEGTGTFRGFAVEPDEPGAPRLFHGVFLTENGVAPELYYQNDPDAIGFNPNEEHAFLTEEAEGAYVAWAMRNDLNVRTNADSSAAVIFVNYALNGKGRMQGFRVVTLSADYPTFTVRGETEDDDGGGVSNDVGVSNGEGDTEKEIPSAYAGQRLIPPAPFSKLPEYDNPKSYAVSLTGDNGNQAVYVDRKSAMWARRDGKVNVLYAYSAEEKYGFYAPGTGVIHTKTAVGWQNTKENAYSLENLTNVNNSTPWTWQIAWPTNGVPKMKVGQTLTKALDGLPEVWNAASMAIAYQPDETNVDMWAVNLIDPTVARTNDWQKLEFDGDFPKEYGFTVGPSGTCFLRQGKYYFTGLPPSISDRFYVDVNAEPTKRMVLVGQLVEKESGGSYLELNVLSDDERQALRNICKTENAAKRDSWMRSVDALARTEVKPVEFKLEDMSPMMSALSQQMCFSNGAAYEVWAKSLQTNANYVVRMWMTYNYGTENYYRVVTCTNAAARICNTNQYVATWHLLKTHERPNDKDPSKRFQVEGEFRWWPAKPSKAPRITYHPRDHYALVATGRNRGYVTLVANDDPDPARVNEGLPVSMHVIEVVPELYVDGIAAVRDPLSKLSELQTMLYRTPLGSAANDYEFEWRRTRPKADGTLPANRETWTVRASGEGTVSVQLGGTGDVEDYVNNYYTLRYRPKKESKVWETLSAAHPDWNGDYEKYAWSAWATPQLAEGWLQRALNSVTPFAQRVEDFYSNPSDIAYTMLEQIGRPYQGDVALNNDNLANVGLLELYQTLFNRVESLLGAMKEPDVDLGKQLLLAATRLNEFYALLGAEAYADAKNPLVGAADGTQFAAGVFSFANQVTTLLDEELALLRGRTASTTFPLLTEPPCYNRLAWNMTKGQTEGEAAYVCNYGIRARDGVLDVNCAAAQYPQGHGDAYGHYLSALTTYYRLIRNPKFAWQASMSEMLMDQKTMNVDYQDEQKFADAALNLAKTGAEAMALTYRKAYAERGGKSEERGGKSEERGGNGMGYFDADAKQAFGYGEWATRTGMGGVYNWMAANALLPPPSNAVNEVFADRGIARIDRSTAYSLAFLCETVKDLDRDLSAFDAGTNPLRLDENTIPFDIDPEALEAAGGERKSHFEQILERTERALGNCRTVLAYANAYGARLRQLQESETDALAARETQERAYDDALVAIYGTPFAGDIGPGGTYPQGYDGPDLYNYNWIDLSPYGLAKLDTAFQTNLTPYYARNSGRAGKVDPMTNAVTTIDYTVTAGGIRIKPERITGVRAAEGTLQGKYRDYILAYQAFTGARDGYAAAVDEMYRVAIDVRLQLSRINIDNSLTFAQMIESIFTTDASTKMENARWDMIRQGFCDTGTMLSNQSGLKVAGASFGNDLELELKLKAEKVDQNQQSVLQTFKASSISNTLALANGFEIGTQIAQTLFDMGVDWYYAVRDNGTQMQAAVDGVSAAIGAVQEKLAALDTAQAAYRAEVERGERLQQERELWRRQLANEATASRYADMFNRVERNLALSRYTTAFDTAQRYVWELAKVYDYETGLLSSDARSGRQFLADVIATRSLGEEGVSISSGTTDGGLCDVVNRLKENWSVLKGRLGINNPDKPEKWFSLRYENFRISPEADGDEMWRMRLRSFKVDDIRADSFFRRYCQPLAGVTGEKEPGLVIAFSTSINGAKNFFGRDLMGGQSQFSPADYATRIIGVGVDFAGYDALTAQTRTGLALEPNVYLVPVGADYMRAPAGTEEREVLKWNVVDQVMPLPYAIGSTQLDDDGWFSSLAGADGIGIGTIRRHSTLRAGPAFNSTRLVGRSVWNDRWLLVIPAASLNSDREKALETFINGVKDIRLGIKAYSRQGN